MIGRVALAAAALLLAAPTEGQTKGKVTGCSSVTSTRIKTTTDRAALNRDIACARAAADVIVAPRAARLAVLDAPLPPVPPPPASTKPIVVGEGDSISLFWSGSHTGLYAASHAQVDYRGLAVGGSRINDGDGGNGLVQRKAKVLAAKPAVVTVLIGGNDLGDGQYSEPQDWLRALWAYTDDLRAQGIKVAVGTVLPLCVPTMPAYTERTRERRPIVNAAIRQARGTHLDAVIDFAADPVMGPDAAACDLALFKDGIHPTEGVAPNGQGRMLAIYAPVVDALLAATPPPVGDQQEPELGADYTKVPPAVATNVDVASLLQPSWGTGAVAPSGAPDVVGAFRFICAPGHLLYDDPVVYPGQPGKSHLHQFFGNTAANGRSTYASLRSTGDSTCDNLLNRSAYWIPAMLDGKGSVVRPDYVTIYYKRRPLSDPECFTIAAKGCASLPRGLRYVFGYDMTGGGQPTGGGYFNCDGPTGTQGYYKLITDAAPFCGVGNHLGALIGSPDCWDGVRLDSPDHRSHMAYSGYYTPDGKVTCPKGYDYLLPKFSLAAWYAVTEGTPSNWYLSSDDMTAMGHGMMKPGSTLHADWFGAWDEGVMAMWMSNCIDKLLNCSGGDLGNGRQMKPAPGFTWEAQPRLVPVPPR